MKQYDLIVAGGGLTGVAAAVSAAREGLSVLLIEKNGCLGGAISNNLVYPFMFYWLSSSEAKQRQYLNAGIFLEIREREHIYCQSCNESEESLESLFKPEYYKFILDDMVTEAGVDVLFHATLFKTQTKDRKVQSVQVVTPSGEISLSADFFIDATGNGDLMAQAGCDYQLGRESDGLCQPMTTCFRMSGVNIEQFKKEHKQLNELYQQQQKEGKIKNPRENILVFYGIGKDIIHFNTTRIIKLNPTDAFDVSQAEIEARRQVYEMVHFLKENSTAFEHSTIINIANEIGIRESRKLKGVHILNQDELKNMVDFEDSIAVGNYEIDIHNPAGGGTTHYYFKEGEYYQIPYRCLLPKEFDNMLVAGRCLSATHEAQASVRIMPICTSMGQAAGTAVAVAHQSGSTVHNVNIKTVQERLTKNGAVLS
ncbi:MAG: FAD-dependent oxidoreductase [Ruminococcaceae bacterium]|nr:FAD-dependent oxidoreductase [Oscillospiraceae bacterium]